jgi:hypothetical protein
MICLGELRIRMTKMKLFKLALLCLGLALMLSLVTQALPLIRPAKAV